MVPGNRAYITEGRLTVTAEASKSGFDNASDSGGFDVDLTAPSVSYAPPASLRIGRAVGLSPTTSDTDIAGYALAAGETLPAGLSLDPTTGVISGPPTEAASASTTALVVGDRAGNRAAVSLSWPAVSKIPQTLTGFAYQPRQIKFGDAAPTLTPPSGAVGALSYRSQTTAVCTVDGSSGALTVLADGTCTVIATAAATPTHLAGTAEATVTISPSAPKLMITSATTTWSHCLEAQHQVPVDWSASGGQPPYTAAGTRVDADTVTVLCPAAGADLTLAVSDSSSPPLTATATVPVTATAALSLSARAESASCETGEQATIIWTLSGGAGPYRVTVNGQTQTNTSTDGQTRNRRTSVECGAAGSQTVSVSASDASRPNTLSGQARVTLTVAAPPTPLLLSASLQSENCKRYGSVVLSWTISGGDPPYEFKVDAQRYGRDARQATVACTSRQPTQTIKLEVLQPGVTAPVLSWKDTVNVSVPDYTFTGQIRARKLTDGRVEFCFQLSTGGDCIKPDNRFLVPADMVDHRWYNSSTVFADYDGDANRTLGQISARKASANARIELAFAAGGRTNRIFPRTRFFDWMGARVDRWHSTSSITHTLVGDHAERSLAIDIGELMDAANGNEPTTPGSDGGSMSDQDSPAPSPGGG
jgi:hypothetical protein